MNDSKNNPKSLPPDDFSATTPNIKIPKDALPEYRNEPANDWEKTNYNYSPKDLKADEWNKPGYHAPPAPQTPPNDFNQSYNAKSSGKEADWGVTQANINVPRNQPSDSRQNYQEDYGSRQSEFGATSAAINLPENDRQKYQNSPPQTVAAASRTDEKKDGIPSWVWAAGGLAAMFLFAVVVLAGVYFLFLNKSGFDVVLVGPPAGSDVRVNSSSWGVTMADGKYRLAGLKAGETKKIDVIAAGWDCKSVDVVGTNGQQIEQIIPCTEGRKAVVPKAGCDPSTFTKGDIPKSHACANEKLDALTENFTVQELLDAMNLYIIQFASGKYNINPEDTKFLEKSAGFIKKLPENVKIEVGGHTDNVGRDNQKLSENRAAAVRDALIKAGVKPEILLTRGYADSQPKDTNATEDGKFRNRRIEYSAILR